MEAKYEMPVLTDSERRLQIDLLTRWDDSPDIIMQTRELIALAALKAEPVHQFIVNNPDHDGYVEWADCNPDYYSKEASDRRRILYTAPPVLKLPDEERETGDLQASEINAAIGWNNCLAEVKALNGVTE